MDTKMSLMAWREENELLDSDDFEEWLEETSLDGVCPALCTEGCGVEPDGHCPHGHPAVTLAAGVI